jgi:hypothetical protein
MSNEDIASKAKESVEQTLQSGERVQQGDMSVSRVPLRDAHSILEREDDRQARRKGRRPLFRGLNLSGVS